MDTESEIVVVECPDCGASNEVSLVDDNNWQFFQSEIYGGDWAKEFECWQCESPFLKFKRYTHLVPIPKRKKETA